ncbi:MAG: hypothetical protein BGO70_12635 [Bacteroidetes bacterium 43-93]|nr:T9SS type A sorting domain-containing protein [Bacteroidota bacterium]OJW99293.1 MAG: hypothetical protein BGO70_12635 [Bacteroidetes bacterium 43-93]
MHYFNPCSKNIFGFLCSILLLFFAETAHAVPTTAAAYPFYSTVGTWNYLVGGNNLPKVAQDDDQEVGINIGFPFPFCTGVYTQCKISSNGYITLGNGGLSYSYQYNGKGTGIEPALMPLWDDLVGSSGSASYITQGTAPNRTFTVEWRDFIYSWSSLGNNSKAISFQVILYEAGVIEFKYHPENGNVVNASATIGIARNTNDYQTLPNTSISPTPSSSAYTTTISTRPVDGQSYIWGVIPCTGVPNFAISGNHLSCPNRNFTLAIAGTVVYTGITYQWQKSSNGNVWNNIPGATTSAITDAITAKTYYRCILECTNSGQTYTTPAWDMDIAPFQYCYCEGGAAVTSGLDIGNVKITAEPGEQRIALDNGLATPAIGNNTASNSYSSFQFSVAPVVMYRDSSFKMDVSEITSDGTMPPKGNVAAYIDYNQNGVFESSEKVMKKSITSTSLEQYKESSTFTVPNTAKIGMTGMRVIISTGNPDSCGFGSAEGEIEDYIVDIRYEPCNNADNPGNIDASTLALCPGYDYLLTDTTYERKKSDLARTWEVSADSIVWFHANNKTNIDTLLRTFGRQPFYYRIKQICPPANNGNGDTVTSVPVHIVPKAGYKCYCYSQSLGGDKDTTDLGGFTLGDYVMNTGSPHLLNPLAHQRRSDFTDDNPIILYTDSLYHMAAYQTEPVGVHADAKITIFMDFNNNKEYDVPYERVFTNYTSISNFTVADTFTVPETVIRDVPTGMRVIINNNLAPNDPSDLGCGAYVSGETLDYIVMFKEKIPAGITNTGSAISNFGLFPNPTNGQVTVQFRSASELKNLDITVTNITGQQVYHQSYSHNGGTFSQRLDLSGAAKGVYFVELKADGERVTQKLVID